jgi:hypothetical protein
MGLIQESGALSSFEETIIPEMNCEDSPLQQSFSDESSINTNGLTCYDFSQA